MQKIKVCGMRDYANIESVLQLDIDFMGFIFYEKSARHIDLKSEQLLQQKLANLPFQQKTKSIQKVGVFVNATAAYVLEKVAVLQLDYVQLHGKETPSYCEKLKQKDIKIIKAFSVGEQFSFSDTDAYANTCDYFIFDTKGKHPGGNGLQFNWQLLEQYQGKTPFLLSGGIGEEDVMAVRKFQHPQLAGVDLNSRFELQAARKDSEALARFVQKIKE